MVGNLVGIFTDWQQLICYHMWCYLKSTVNNIYNQIKGNEESISENPLSQSWEILIYVL